MLEGFLRKLQYFFMQAGCVSMAYAHKKMANALCKTNADKAHQSSTEASEDEDMEIRESQGLLPAAEENEKDNEPWINVTSRARRRRLQTRSTTPQLSRTPPKPVLRQSRPAMRQPRQPPLPADDYKLAVIPRNGLQLNKVSPGKLVDAIRNETKLKISSTGFKIRIDEDQNILVLSTASEATASALSKMQKTTIGATTYDIASYGISPDNSCKGVIYDIDHDTTPEMLLKRIESPGYEALTFTRLGNTTTMVITFLGKTVAYCIEFSGLLLRCCLYKRTVPLCRTCNERGHREDRESPDGSQNLPQQIPATRQPSESAAGPESRLLVSEATSRALSFPQVAIPEATRSCPGEEQFQAAFRFRFQAQDLIATTDAIPMAGPRAVDVPQVAGGEAREQRRSRSRCAGRRLFLTKLVPPPPVDTGLTQAHAHIRRLTEENTTLKTEITNVHAEFVAVKDE
ncbi:hypothetical protein HPB49_023676 [Dermacentor silvarum]|uniref:Uncharacterized protein n=1 Tax=Dermacentor silvarum TaxID=543639 RepID=A0ACB8CI02_DERSI|nr:hypothetical protein HPB49_023676 [Dermacentor silvarum]